MYSWYTIAVFMAIILCSLFGIYMGFRMAYRTADSDYDTPHKQHNRPNTQPPKDIRPSLFDEIDRWIRRLFTKRDTAQLKEKIHHQDGMSLSEFSCIDADEDHEEKLCSAMSHQDGAYKYITQGDIQEH